MQDRLDLEAQRRLALPVAIAEQQPGELAPAQRLAATRYEQAHPLRGVGRIREHQVGRFAERRRHAQAKVGEPAVDLDPQLGCGAVDVLEQVVVHVNHR